MMSTDPAEDNEEPLTTPAAYSVVDGASSALHHLLSACQDQVPQEFSKHAQHVAFTSSSQSAVYFPTPLKEQEAGAALKALEACGASAIADLRYGREDSRNIDVDMDKTTCFLMSAYLATVAGKDKASPEVKKFIPGNIRPYPTPPRSTNTLLRHRPQPSPVHPLPQAVGQPVRDQDPGGILPHPRLPRRHQNAEDARPPSL